MFPKLSRRDFLWQSLVSAAGAVLVSCRRAVAPEPTEPPLPEPTETPLPEPTETPLPEPTAPSGGVMYSEKTIYEEVYPALPQGGEAVFALPDQVPKTLDLTATIQFASFHTVDGVYDFLEHYDHDGNLVGSLAKELEVVDNRTLKYTLHEGITFHNGRELTAEDVQESIRHVQDEEHGSPVRSDMLGVEAEVVDPLTVLLKLDEPNAAIRSTLQRVPIIPIEEASKLDTEPVSCGPFMFEEWRVDQYVEVVKNPDFWNPQAPRLDRIRILLPPDITTATESLLAGEVDYLHDANRGDKDRIDRQEGLHTLVTERGFVYMMPNHLVEPYDNPKVRRAMSLALDREALADAPFKGLARPQWFPGVRLESPYYPKNLEFPRDVERAKTLLTEAGYPDGFEDTLLTLSFDYFQGTAVLIQSYLREIGIDLELEVLDLGALVDRVITNQDFHLTMLGDSLDPEPAATLDRYLGTGGGANWMGYSSEEADDLLNQGRTTFAPEQRQAIYREFFEQAIVEDAAFMVITTEPYLAAYKEGVNAGQFVPSPNARMHWPIMAKE